MSTVAQGTVSRRTFLRQMGAAGMAGLSRPAWMAALPAAVKASAAQAGKAVNLLEDGGFEGSAWGWQFTRGAGIDGHARRAGLRSIRVQTDAGDYARFLVLGPEAGKTYTLSGWIKTDAIVAREENAGAYFAASQFEFQGRPTEFTVDGKQLPEKRLGNFAGTSGWQRFSQSFRCLPGTTWFEVIAGIYRASGAAWFSELTFVEGDTAVELKDTVDYWAALEMAHNDGLQSSRRKRPAAAVLHDQIPVRGAAADPAQLKKILGEFYEVALLNAEQLADPGRLNRAAFDLLVLPYGESFPLPARQAVEKFLSEGGDLLTTGGYAFQSPLIRESGQWRFYSEAVREEKSENLLPAMAAGTAWHATAAEFAAFESAELPQLGSCAAGRIEIPDHLWERSAWWQCTLAASGEGNQYAMAGWIETGNVQAAPAGSAFVSIAQLNESGDEIYSTVLELERLENSRPWHRVERMVCLSPDCRQLRVAFGLNRATGTIRGAQFRLERRSPQVRINTASGNPQDELQIAPDQIGMFDASFPLQRVAALRPAPGQTLVDGAGEFKADCQGYAATCVVGMNHARWIPLLNAYDALGRKRGAAGALAHHVRGAFARGSWAFFGVDNHDLFSAGSALGEGTLRALGRTFTRKCFLHGCETDFACYRQGEPVRARALVTNLGRGSAELELRWRIVADGSVDPAFSASRPVVLKPGQTYRDEVEWRPEAFSAPRYGVSADLMAGALTLDRIETGFAIWSTDTLKKGLAFDFKDNYFQVDGRSVFLQGTDDYLHTFIDQDENPLTWHGDAQGCRDACIDVYENLMGLRGAQQQPTETWWRWIDAMLLNVQDAGGVFFPGLLIFSNTAVGNAELAEQQAYARAFAARYKEAAGLIYYLNGDLELHDPNLPDIQPLYRRYLRSRYGSDEALRQAWAVSPPEAPMERLPIRSGKDDWRDVRTLDDFEFRTQLVRRWLDALHQAIRQEDVRHPVTAEFYQEPFAGIDLPTALGELELANFGYFNAAEEDFYRFPQVLKFLDQRLRGKGVNIGEFGVKTHPAWRNSSGYLDARSENYEHAYFLAIAHYAFALGASKIQNWCWKYPSDLPFEWGINYSNELVARDVRAFYRNSGLFFRGLRPRYRPDDVVMLVAGENRKGGKGASVLAGISNGIRLLIDRRVPFNTLADEFIEDLPGNVTTILYPLPYCPNDTVVARLQQFVERGGQLYLSGDLSYDRLRQRTQAQRLKNLCGVEFVRERYANIDYGAARLPVRGLSAGWPDYMAAPGIEMRLAGARALVATAEGVPVVTEFAAGSGRVIFSADPIELHGDARCQPYAHAFYAALCRQLRLRQEKIEPEAAPVHCFRVPSQDGSAITVLVNCSAGEAVNGLVVPTRAGKVTLSLGARLSGAIVEGADHELHAVESSADVTVDGQLSIGSDLHFMAASMDGRPLRSTLAMMLLPMGEGRMRIPNASRWRRPLVLTGEMSGGQWKEGERFEPERDGDTLPVPISATRRLSILIVCEAADRDAATRRLELRATRPWLTEI